MSTEPTDRFADVLNEVSGWSAEAKRSLASRILDSLNPQGDARRATPTDLIGVWNVGQSPSDEEVERIIEDEIMRKHG